MQAYRAYARHNLTPTVFRFVRVLNTFKGNLFQDLLSFTSIDAAIGNKMFIVCANSEDPSQPTYPGRLIGSTLVIT